MDANASKIGNFRTKPGKRQIEPGERQIYFSLIL